MVPRLAAMVAATPVALFASTAMATPGPTIQTNDYNVEVFQGPVLAPLRVTGLAGAYTAYAEGVDGIAANAAAPAVRFPHSFDTFDWDASFGIAFPATFRHTDFDNDGNTGFVYEDFIFYTLGAMVQWGPVGAGALGDTQRYVITPRSTQQDEASSTLNLRRIDITTGWALLDHQLMLGAGARAAWLDIRTSTASLAADSLVSMTGVAPQFGMLLRPDFQPWRLGLTYRAQVRGDVGDRNAGAMDPDGVRRAAGLAIPASIYVPWEIRAGFALQLGPRPLNPRWIDPEKQERSARARVAAARRARAIARAQELQAIRDPRTQRQRATIIDEEEAYLREEEDTLLDQLEDQMREERRARFWNWPRQHILVVAEALVTGPTPNAVSVESLLSQNEKRAGQDPTVTPRLGIEAEPVVEHVKTRIGTYIEPSRFRGRAPRQHFTFGFDVRLFEFAGWGPLSPGHLRISGMADLAPRYENFGASLGAWY
jgi:hypothetical protein